jgi:glycosyltransferase involved in cell wall biosynthesis
MKKNPLVSVVMPAYNASATIGNAIMSIINQTYENWELLIVDDGSDDRAATEKVIIKFNDERIKYIPIEHADVVGARMAGYKKAKGDLLAVQDADDLSMPDRLEKVVQYFRDNPDADIVCHTCYVNFWNAHHNCITREYRVLGEEVDKDRILQEQYLPGYPVFKKHVIKDKPLRETTRYAYDWSMWVDWVFAGYKIGFIHEALYEYVRHMDSLSVRNEQSGRRGESLKEMQRICKEEYNVEFKPKDWEL